MYFDYSNYSCNNVKYYGIEFLIKSIGLLCRQKQFRSNNKITKKEVTKKHYFGYFAYQNL